MSIDDIHTDALKLSVGERAALAEILWESIGDPYDLAVSLSDEEALTLALQRDREIESGAATPLSHDEMMRRLRK
jgi:putative addiction module component (TIGR02574 family)